MKGEIRTYQHIYCPLRHWSLGYKLLDYERNEMERVLCVKARDLWEHLGVWQGFRPTTSVPPGGSPFKTDIDLLLGGACEFAWVERTRAEQDASWKQLIPYVIFGHMTGGRLDIFNYRRGKAGGEARLHAKLSIAIGGHINPEDGTDLQSHSPHPIKMFDPRQAYFRGLSRELHEELHFRHEVWSEPKLKGLIYDPANSVGEVHLGVVHTILLDERGLIEPKDEAMKEPDWCFVDLLQKAENLEGWTEILLPHLDKLFN